MATVKDFQAETIQTIRLGGQEFRVGPLTMGMRRRIAGAIAKVQPPPSAVVDVQGLVEAMYRPTGNGDDVPKELRAFDRAKVRDDIKAVVSEMVREQVAFRQQWPPMIETLAGQDLIFNNADVQDRFIQVVLQAYNPDFDPESVADLVEAMGAHEFLELHRLVFSSINEMGRQQDEGNVPKSSDAGGDSALSQPRSQTQATP